MHDEWMVLHQSSQSSGGARKRALRDSGLFSFRLFDLEVG